MTIATSGGFAVVEGRAELQGRTEEEVVHLPLLISLVEVICRGGLDHWGSK